MESYEKLRPSTLDISSSEHLIDLDQHYGSTALNVLSRFQLYRHSIDNRDMHQEIAEELSLQNNDTVIDVGCADGQFLEKLIKTSPVQLNIIGIELDHELLKNAYNRRDVLKDTHLITANANNLPLKDNSIDGLYALFMLYHSKEPTNTLREFHRVLKASGRLAVATSGPNNKIKHREFEHKIADFLNIVAPPTFSAPFNSKNAEDQLHKSFKIKKHISQSSEIHITDENYEDYILSLQSMKGVFIPEPKASSWMRAVNKLVVPRIKHEICSNGFFSDTIDRHYYICSPRQ